MVWVLQPRIGWLAIWQKLMVKQKVILEQVAQIVDFSQQKTVKKRAKTGVFEQKKS